MEPENLASSRTINQARTQDFLESSPTILPPKVSKYLSRPKLEIIQAGCLLICSGYLPCLGLSGLYTAETLLRKKKETSVCVFEKEDRFGGRIFDYWFPQAPDISVGKVPLSNLETLKQ